MIAFRFLEVIASVIFAALHGFIMGISLYAADALMLFFRNIFIALKSCFSFSDKPEFSRIKKFKPAAIVKGKIFCNLKDFLFVLLYGISFLIFCYTVMDGVFRLYLILISVLSCFVSTKFLGKMLARLFVSICDAPIRAVFALLFVMLFPINKLFWLLHQRIAAVVKIAKNSLLKRMKSLRQSVTATEATGMRNASDIPVYTIKKIMNNKVDEEKN